MRELVAGDNSLFVAGFRRGRDMFRLLRTPPPFRRGLFIMRIERAEGDKDPVRSLSPIHPLYLAPSFFASLSLSLSPSKSSIFRNEHVRNTVLFSLSLSLFHLAIEELS